MNIEEILDMWEKDNDINNQKDLLDEEIIRLKKLHPKYQKLLTKVCLHLNKKEQELDKLYLEKYKFYKDGPTKLATLEEIKLCPGGGVLKTDIPIYIDGDPDYSILSLKIKNFKTMKDSLDRIMKEIAQYGYYLNNLLAAKKWQNGEM